MYNDCYCFENESGKTKYSSGYRLRIFYLSSVDTNDFCFLYHFVYCFCFHAVRCEMENWECVRLSSPKHTVAEGYVVLVARVLNFVELCTTKKGGEKKRKRSRENACLTGYIVLFLFTAAHSSNARDILSKLLCVLIYNLLVRIVRINKPGFPITSRFILGHRTTNRLRKHPLNDAHVAFAIFLLYSLQQQTDIPLELILFSVLNVTAIRFIISITPLLCFALAVLSGFVEKRSIELIEMIRFILAVIRPNVSARSG